jgi:RNA polymerase sigma-70 factor, ECF subfamily
MKGRIDTDLQKMMVRLADGDRSALHPTFEMLWPLLRRFTARHLPHAEAEDAAQEALVKIFRQAGRFDPARSAAAWALGVAGFEIRTARRRFVRRREAYEAEKSLATLPDAAKNPEEILLDRDLEETLLEVLGELRPQDVETLRLYARGERPTIAPATFRKRVERALDRLRSAWSSTHELP